MCRNYLSHHLIHQGLLTHRMYLLLINKVDEYHLLSPTYQICRFVPVQTRVQDVRPSPFRGRLQDRHYHQAPPSLHRKYYKRLRLSGLHLCWKQK